MSPNNTRDLIENALAQTQCQLCDYPSCKDYADAIFNKKTGIDKCLPGGKKTLTALSKITKVTLQPEHFKKIAAYQGMETAYIREDSCIGCTKCIQACPVDAILGSAKKMHSVLSTSCNGCALCVPVCPVDCIELSPHPHYSDAHLLAEPSKLRYERKKKRLAIEKTSEPLPTLGENRLEIIHAAIQRAKKKKDAP